MLTEVIKDNPKTGELWIKTFLIDSSMNRKKWGVTQDSIPRYIYSGINKPITLFKNQDPKTGSSITDHPWFRNLSMDQNLQIQERWAVGRIKDIVEDKNKDGTWYAVCSITDPMAAETIRKHKTASLPLYVSPAIVHYAEHENSDGSIFKWEMGHLAIVSDPAYPAFKAIIKDHCDGDATTCLMQLKTASIECMGKILDEILEKNFTSLEKTSSDLNPLYKMSSNTSDAGNADNTKSSIQQQISPAASTPIHTSPTPNITTPASTGAIQFTTPNTDSNNQQSKPEEQSKQEQQSNDWNTREQQYNAKIAELTAKLQDTENSKTSEIQKLQDQIDKINKRNELDQRRAQIQAVIPMDLFTNANGRFDEQAYINEIEKRTKSTWSIDEISDYYDNKFEIFQFKQSANPRVQSNSRTIEQQAAEREEIPQEIQVPTPRAKRASMSNASVAQLDTIASMQSPNNNNKKNSSLWFLDVFDSNVNSSNSSATYSGSGGS